MSLWDYSGPERRKFKRVQKFFVVSIQSQDKESSLKEWEIVGLENLSEEGMLFNHNGLIKAEAALNIRINILPDKDPVQCVGRIVHSQKLGQLELYEYGIHFKEMRPEDRILIRQALGS